jgi:hypothetical protein
MTRWTNATCMIEHEQCDMIGRDAQCCCKYKDDLQLACPVEHETTAKKRQKLLLMSTQHSPNLLPNVSVLSLRWPKCASLIMAICSSRVVRHQPNVLLDH